MAELSFINPLLNFQQRDKINDIKKQTDTSRVDFMKTMNLGVRVPEQKWDYYDQLYGHNKWDMRPDPIVIRAPPNINYRPISQLLNYTDEMLVNVSGTMYKNKDLPILKVRKGFI